MITAAGFPLSSPAWFTCWLGLGGVIAVAVTFRAGLLSNAQRSSGTLVEAFGQRVVANGAIAGIMLPIGLLGLWLEDPARDAWNARWGTCASMFTLEDAADLLGPTAELSSTFEMLTHCAVRYTNEIHQRAELDIETYGGAHGSAWEWQQERVCGDRVCTTIDWSRRASERHFDANRVLMLELPHGGALDVTFPTRHHLRPSSGFCADSGLGKRWWSRCSTPSLEPAAPPTMSIGVTSDPRAPPNRTFLTAITASRTARRTQP